MDTLEYSVLTDLAASGLPPFCEKEDSCYQEPKIQWKWESGYSKIGNNNHSKQWDASQ